MVVMMMMMIGKGTEKFWELYTFNVNQQMPKIRQNHNNVIILGIVGKCSPAQLCQIKVFNNYNSENYMFRH
jgi:hypothetical protein